MFWEKYENQWQEKLSRTPYQLAYILSLVLLYLAYFLKRYGELGHAFHWWLSVLAILASASMYVWGLRRWGLSRERLLAGLFALAFLVLLPSDSYLITSVADLSLLGFFFLSVSVDKSDQRMVSTLFYIKLVGALLILWAYNAQLIPDMTMPRPDSDIIRHSYGFGHPNSLGMYVLTLIFDFALIKQATKVPHILGMLFVSLLTYAITDSRTTLLIIIWVILAYTFKPFLENYSLSYRSLLPMMWLLIVLGVALPYCYNEQSGLYAVLDDLFSGRLHIGDAYFQRFGWSLWPRNIAISNDFNGRSYFNDSFYVDSLMHQGIFLSLLYPILLTVQLFKKRLNLYHASLFLITFLICMMEGYGASIFICTILLVHYFDFEDGE